jgi:hypothetical protein
MTRHPHRPTGSAGGRRVTRDQFPSLSEFLAGYLHEDFPLDYGTPRDATRAFVDEATPAERDRVDRELRRFLAQTEGWPLEEFRHALAALGAAWQPASRAELEALLSRLADD